MSKQDAPLFAPWWFVQRFNEAEWARHRFGDPAPRYRTALDPLVMLAWHQAASLPPLPLIVTGV